MIETGAQLTGGVPPTTTGDSTGELLLGSFDRSTQLLNLTLTFTDDSLTQFHGTAASYETPLDPGLSSILSYRVTTYDFTGAAVPLPSAAWLLGSGLLGLAGMHRRRSH